VSANGEKFVTLGRVSGAYGIKGWVKVHSYTEQRESIAQFDAWVLEQRGTKRRLELEASKHQGKSVLVKLGGIDDREAARALIGATIMVERAALPPCAPGEYYWADLEGLTVRTVEGEVLGTVDHLLATPGHDVLVLEGGERRLIPFVAGSVVRGVDLDAGVVVVEWDKSYWE
jgi:16S rRNA processing protein RimM